MTTKRAMVKESRRSDSGTTHARSRLIFQNHSRETFLVFSTFERQNTNSGSNRQEWTLLYEAEFYTAEAVTTRGVLHQEWTWEYLDLVLLPHAQHDIRIETFMIPLS